MLEHKNTKRNNTLYKHYIKTYNVFLPAKVILRSSLDVLESEEIKT